MEDLLERVRRALDGRDAVEKRMVGGRSFLVDGKLCVGVTKGGLMVRVGKEGRDRALAEPHVLPMVLGKKRVAAFVIVEPEGVRGAALGKWVARAVAAAGPEEDARLTELVQAFQRDRQLAPIAREFEAERARGVRKFGANGLKVNGKLFALVTRGTLVVKLPKERVAELVSSRIGVPFQPGPGRTMKEWLELKSRKASWIELAKEAYRFVKG